MSKFYFTSWPAATYDVKFCSHSNPSILLTCLKLGAREKRTASANVMFYRLGKNSEKPQTGVAAPPPTPPPSLVHSRVNLITLLFVKEKSIPVKISLRQQEFNIPCKFYLMSKAFLLTPSLSLTSFITCSSGSSSDLILCKKRKIIPQHWRNVFIFNPT